MAKLLVNDQYRQIIEKWFDNERTFSVPIIGASNMTFTAALAKGATSATLTSAWTQPTSQQYVNFSSGDQRMCQFINGSTSVTWNVGLSTSATTSASGIGVRDYPIPAQISKIKDAVLTVGQIAFPIVWVQSRIEWDWINTIPYGSDIPFYAFIWNGTLGIWPIPQTANNVLTFNYKSRVPDMTFTDYTTGTISAATAGEYTVTGSGTSWNTTGNYPLNTNITHLNLGLRIDPPYGDGLWYIIQSFQSDTSLTLAQPIYQVYNISNATYTIAQLPILQEDFHDMLVYGALKSYYASIVKDEGRFKMFDDLFNSRLELLEDYAGTKAVSVDLENTVTLQNPNIYTYYPQP